MRWSSDWLHVRASDVLRLLSILWSAPRHCNQIAVVPPFHTSRQKGTGFSLCYTCLSGRQSVPTFVC